MAASRACGRSRAAAMQGSSGQSRCHVSGAQVAGNDESRGLRRALAGGVQKVNCRKAAREAPLEGAAAHD